MLDSDKFYVPSCPLVVGYKGSVGRFILNGLLRELPTADSVLLVESNYKKADIEARINKSDLIFLCVPTPVVVPWVNEYFNLLKDKIVLEQSSRKDEKPHWDLKVFGMHLLFNPEDPPANKTFLISRLCSRPEPDSFYALDYRIQDFVAKILQAKRITIEYPEQHDEMMSAQQGLVHRVLASLYPFLVESNCRTYLGDKTLEVIQRMRKGSKVVYEDIQKNKHLSKDVEKFIKNLTDPEIVNSLWK